jgi:F0F1-type ATP synthase membrane subunit b/b'
MPILPLLYAFLNLVILVLMLFFFFRKTVKGSLIVRKENFINKSKESEDFYHEAAKKHDEIRTKLQNIYSDGKTFVKNVERDSTIEGERLLADARKISAIIADDAAHLAEMEIKNALNRIKSNFISKTMVEAKVKIDNKVNDIKRNEYIDEYSRSLKSTKKELR